MADNSKNRVPPVLRQILNYDIERTKNFVIWSQNLLPIEETKKYYKILELSCHGIVWFAFWIALTWLFNKPSLVQLQMNILLALLVDIVIVAVAKAYFRRKRPVANKDDAFGQLGPDIFSFPSGHVTRGVMVTFIFTQIYGVSFLFRWLLYIWCVCLCFSRILLQRHYILDVIGGFVIGLFEGLLMLVLWLENDTALYIYSFLSDDKIDGGDFHV